MAAIYISNFRNFRAARQRGNRTFMRHPFLTFSFLLILTLPVWLTLGWYGQRAAIQLEAQRELQETHSLEWLSFSRHEAKTLLRWEHDHEFEWEGRMYDVKEKRISADSLWIWCYLDEKETSWLEVLANWKSDAPDSTTPPGTLLLTSFLNGYFCQSINLPFPGLNPISQPQPQPQPLHLLDAWGSGPPTPPPRC
jgi:hypothetical protein